MAEEKIAPFKERVLELMTELVAPKDSFNSFAKYNYRSAESITQALKPMCIKYKVLPNMTEENSEDGVEAPWVRAIVTLYDVYSEEKISSCSKVFIDTSKKGMSKEQMSGAALSYARKYALGGLLLIDDTKDPDTDEYHRQTNNNASAGQKADTGAGRGADGPITEAEAKILEKMALPGQKKWALSRYKVNDFKELTKSQYAEFIAILKKREEKEHEAKSEDKQS